MEITTFTALAGGDERVGLFELAVLERRLQERLDALDARVQRHLSFAGGFTDDQVAGIDVLCAAIGEARELHAAVRRERHAERARRRDRRDATRRWV
jgi:hypothetical protein